MTPMPPRKLDINSSKKREASATRIHPLSSSVGHELFVPQRYYRIDFGRAPRWNIPGQQRNGGEEPEHDRERQRVKHADAIQQSFVLVGNKIEPALQKASQGERRGHTDREPHQAQHGSPAHRESENRLPG